MNNIKSYLFIGTAAIAVAFLVMKKEGEPLFSHRSNGQIERQNREIDAAKRAAMPYVVPTIPTVAGNYLSARFAVANNDLISASRYYQKALELAKSKQDKKFLYERTLPAALGAGDIKEAIRFAGKLDLSEPTLVMQLGVLTKLAEGFKNEDYEGNTELLAQLRNSGFGRLLKPLLESWNAAGQDNFAAAEATLATLQQEYPSLKPLVQMHLAFLYDLQNKPEKAERYYIDALSNNLSIRSAHIIASFYERQNKIGEVKGLYEKLATTMPGAALPALILKRIEQGKLDNRPFISRPLDGVGAALYDVATVLHQEGSSRLAILYAQMAHYLVPQDDFTKLLLSDILSDDMMRGQAKAFLESVGRDSDLYMLAQMRLSQIYEQEGDFKKAIAILEGFRKDPVTRLQATMELGDLNRRREDFASAIPFYTEVINEKKTTIESDWVLFYSRGMCYERNKQWNQAEQDLLRALQLSPQQPEVLNYLAYSWADHGKNVPQALEMLQKALASAPGDPYIIDSVGWALYKNGQPEEAVFYLETAVQELPADPVINGHLGDAYWTVGRRLEARFQWERALKNTKSTDDALRMEFSEKLKNGLPVSRKAEAAPSKNKNN